MKYLKYIVRNTLRNKMRTLLTVLSLCFSLAMTTVLYGYLATQEAWHKEATKNNRIVVMNIQGFSGLLPVAYVDRIRNLDGIKAAVPYSWYGGTYKEETMAFAQFGTDASQAFDVFDEYRIDPEQLSAWRNNRRGCVVDRRLANRRGWKIGERIPLKGTYYQFNLDLELCGIYDTPKPVDSLWFHLEYLDEGLRAAGARGSGNSGTIFAKISSPEQIAPVSKKIDEVFASSPNPTRTQTEAAFAQMFVDMMGNLQAYIQNIAIAVVFSLTLVAGNAMAMSMRERTTEIAVLKAIGFQRHSVLSMVLGESCLVALLGGICGVAMGCGFIQLIHQLSPQFFPMAVVDLIGLWLAYLLGVATMIGLVSGLFPALRAARLSVIDGLRNVA